MSQYNAETQKLKGSRNRSAFAFSITDIVFLGMPSGNAKMQSESCIGLLGSFQHTLSRMRVKPRPALGRAVSARMWYFHKFTDGAQAVVDASN